MAVTGAFHRFGTRLVKYSRSGTPTGTVRGMSRVWSFPDCWGAAATTEINENNIARPDAMIPLT